MNNLPDDSDELKKNNPQDSLEDVIFDDDVFEVHEIVEAESEVRPSEPLTVRDDEDIFAVEFGDEADGPSSFPFRNDSAVQPRKPREPEHVIDTGDVRGPGSSVINWEEIGETPSAAIIAEDPDLGMSLAADESNTESAEPGQLITEADLVDPISGVDLGKHAEPVSQPASGFDPVAEELESGVLRSKRGVADDSAQTMAFNAEEFDEGVRTRKIEHDEDLVNGVTEFDQPLTAGIPPEDDLLESEAADFLSADDEEEVVTALPDGDDEISFDAPDASAEEQVAGVAIADDDEEQEKPPSKKKSAVAAAPSGKAKRGGGLLIGTMLGVLLTAAGLGAVWYFAPDLLDQIPASPNASKKPPVVAALKPAPLTPLQLVRVEMDEGRFDKAVDLLKDADKNPANLTTLAEARWQKYVREQEAKKAPLSANDTDAKQVLDELKEAKNDVLVAQVSATLNEKDLRDKVANQKELEESLSATRDVLAKAGLSDAKADVKELTPAVNRLVTDRQQLENHLDGLRKVLADHKLVKGEEKLEPQTLEKLISAVEDNSASLAAVDKLLKQVDVKGAGAKGVEELVTSSKDVENRLAAVDQLLAKEKLASVGVKGVQELANDRAKLLDERAKLDAELQQTTKALQAASQKAESPLTIPLTEVAVTLSKIAASGSKLLEKGNAAALLAAELAYYHAREPFLAGSERRLDDYALMMRDPKNLSEEQSREPIRFATWLLSPEAKSSREVQAKAHYVLALAQLDREQFADAKTNLEQAVQLGASNSPLSPASSAKEMLVELTSPADFLVKHVDPNIRAGQLQNAINELNVGLKIFPGNQDMLARRGVAVFDLARSKGKVDADTQRAIRADVGPSADKVADAAYALGALEEESGNLSKAETYYRQAIRINSSPRYTAALARLLLRARSSVGPAIAAPVPSDEKKTSSLPAMQSLEKSPYFVLTVLIGLQAPFDIDEAAVAAQAARTEESIRLANQLIASDDLKIKGEGYIILGQALAKQGRRTEGLKVFSKGLETLYPGLESKELTKMIEEHPAFQQPDIAPGANPYLAEQHFGNGLHMYWSRQYPEAEKEFKDAVRLYDKDARYEYYLGLSQLAQKTILKRDAAYVSFEQGAKLEAVNRPTSADVNASLERLQGDLRVTLDQYRDKGSNRGEK